MSETSWQWADRMEARLAEAEGADDDTATTIIDEVRQEAHSVLNDRALDYDDSIRNFARSVLVKCRKAAGSNIRGLFGKPS